MYDIYIQNYLNANGVLQTSEALLYSIPIAAANKEKILIDPTVKVEMGKAGTFEFTIHPNNPYYNCWKQMKTLMRVVYDGDTIFRGRALTIDNTLFGAKKIHFEGDLAFLIDSQQPATKEEKRATISIYAYLQQIINNHNSQVSEDGSAYKQFTLGEVPGHYTNAVDAQQVHPDATHKYGSSSWETSMQALEALQKDYGGYFRTRYVNGTIYLDWLDNFYDGASITPKQIIKIGENLIDLNSNAEVDNIFTALIPIGVAKGEEINILGYRTDIHGANNKRILVPQIVSLFTDEQLNSGYHSKSDYQNAINDYGIIVKTQKFENADTQQKLWEYAIDFIKTNYIGGLTSFTLSAVDMHHIDGTVAKYLCGERIPVMYPDVGNRSNNVTPLITKTLTALSITYNLHNPEKNSYSLGIPNNIIQKKYGTATSKKSGSGYSNKQEENDEDLKIALSRDKDGMDELAWQYVINEKYNNEEYQQLLHDDPNLQYAPVVLKTAKHVIKGLMEDDPRANQLYNSIILDGNKGEVGFMQNPKLGEMAQATKSIIINGYTSKLTIKEMLSLNQQTSPKTIMEMYSDPEKFLQFQVWKKGKLKEDPQATLAAMISGEDGTISSIISKLGLDGSGLKSTIIQDGLTSMLKFFNPSSASTQNPTETAEIDGTNGKSKVGKDSNGNWQVKLNETITYTDQDGNQQTASGFVSAKDFNLPEVSSFKTQVGVFQTAIMARATIGQLDVTNGRIDTLNANKLSTSNLYSAISALESVNVQSLTSNRGGISVYSVGTTTFTQGGVDCYVPSSIKAVQIVGTANPNEYQLQYKTFGHDEWSDAGSPFRKAAGVSSVVWGWSGGKARATIYFTDGTSQVEESPALDYYDQTGTPNWASNKKSFTQQIKVYDESDPPTEIATLSGEHAFSTVESFNAGWMKAILDCEFPSTGNNNPITVKMPNNETVEGTARTRSYTLSADNDYVYLKRTDSGMNATVGRTPNPAYGNGRSYGQAEAGLELDTVNKKVKRSLSSNVKEYSITATATITYDSSTHKYTAGAQSKAGTANMQYHSVESGLEAYNDGFDAGHGIWLTSGAASSGSSDALDSGKYHITYEKTTGRTEVAHSWEAPGCWLDIVTYDSTAEVLGFDTTLALVKTWSTGRRDVVKKWNTPAASSAYPNTIALKQQAGYAGASKMVMYYKDNNGNYHAAGGGASLAWYMSATSMGNTGSYKTLRYE